MKYFTMNKSEKNQVNDGVLYFSQRIDEMLNQSTYHIYKAPVLNTYLLIKEYISTEELVSQDIINETHLEYIFEEFLESFRNDIILKEYVPEEDIIALIQKLQSSNSVDKNKIMHYMLRVFIKYDYWCKKYIETIVFQKRSKQKIEKVLRCYIPGLIARGYDANYIHYHNKKTFNQHNKTDVEMFNEFISRFDFKPRKYKVFVALHNSVNEFKDVLIKHLGVLFDFDVSEAKGFKYLKKKYILAKLEIEALDKYEAAHIAYEHLDLFYKFYKFTNDDRQRWHLDKCMVIYDETDYAFINLKVRRFSFPENIDASNSSRLSAKVITALLTNAEQSFEQINKIISLHNQALESTDLSNGFLTLWSILEVLFITDKNCSKINEIQKKMIPLLQKEYMIMVFKCIDADLQDNLTAEQYDLLLRDIEGSDSKYKITALITLEKYSQLREELYDWLNNVPLLRSRIANLNSICTQRCSYKKELDRFTRRITWHIIRLYRTRNAIIHSGEITDNLKPLTEHLHSYVDVCIWLIITALTIRRYLCTIDNVLIDEMFQVDKIIKELERKEPFEKDDCFLCCNSVKYSTSDSPKALSDNH